MIKITTKDGTFYYSKFKWNLAWIITFLTGVLFGIGVTLL